MRRASPCAPPWGQEWHDESTDTADLNDPMSFKSLLGYVWASPATAIGLLCVTAAVCGGAKLRRVDGVLEIAGGRLLGAVRRIPRFGFVAITLGHVVMGVDDGCLAEARAHEHVHVSNTSAGVCCSFRSTPRRASFRSPAGVIRIATTRSNARRVPAADLG